MDYSKQQELLKQLYQPTQSASQVELIKSIIKSQTPPAPTPTVQYTQPAGPARPTQDTVKKELLNKIVPKTTSAAQAIRTIISQPTTTQYSPAPTPTIQYTQPAGPARPTPMQEISRQIPNIMKAAVSPVHNIYKYMDEARRASITSAINTQSIVNKPIITEKITPTSKYYLSDISEKAKTGRLGESLGPIYDVGFPRTEVQSTTPIEAVTESLFTSQVKVPVGPGYNTAGLVEYKKQQEIDMANRFRDYKKAEDSVVNVNKLVSKVEKELDTIGQNFKKDPTSFKDTPYFKVSTNEMGETVYELKGDVVKMTPSYSDYQKALSESDKAITKYQSKLVAYETPEYAKETLLGAKQYIKGLSGKEQFKLTAGEYAAAVQKIGIGTAKFISDIQLTGLSNRIKPGETISLFRTTQTPISQSSANVLYTPSVQTQYKTIGEKLGNIKEYGTELLTRPSVTLPIVLTGAGLYSAAKNIVGAYKGLRTGEKTITTVQPLSDFGLFAKKTSLPVQIVTPFTRREAIKIIAGEAAKQLSPIKLSESGGAQLIRDDKGDVLKIYQYGKTEQLRGAQPTALVEKVANVDGGGLYRMKASATYRDPWTSYYRTEIPGYKNQFYVGAIKGFDTAAVRLGDIPGTNSLLFTPAGKNKFIVTAGGQRTVVGQSVQSTPLNRYLLKESPISFTEKQNFYLTGKGTKIGNRFSISVEDMQVSPYERVTFTKGGVIKEGARFKTPISGGVTDITGTSAGKTINSFKDPLTGDTYTFSKSVGTANVKSRPVDLQFKSITKSSENLPTFTTTNIQRKIQTGLTIEEPPSKPGFFTMNRRGSAQSGIFYHGTSAKNIPEIQQKGLQLGRTPSSQRSAFAEFMRGKTISLTRNIAVAEKFAGAGGEVVVVKLSPSETRALKTSPYTPGEYKAAFSISPKEIVDIIQTKPNLLPSVVDNTLVAPLKTTTAVPSFVGTALIQTPTPFIVTPNTDRLLFTTIPGISTIESTRTRTQQALIIPSVSELGTREFLTTVPVTTTIQTPITSQITKTTQRTSTSLIQTPVQVTTPVLTTPTVQTPSSPIALTPVSPAPFRPYGNPPYIPRIIIPEIPESPETPTISKKKAVLKSRTKGYYVLTYKRKKAYLITPRPLTREQALGFGLKYTKSTERATFKLVPSKKPATISTVRPVTEKQVWAAGYRPPKGRKGYITGKEVYIQRRPTRLKTPMEIKAVQSYKKINRGKSIW